MIGELLKTIQKPSDLRNLDMNQLMDLAEEIRHLIKVAVSRNGGHLASNLGVVEMTMAMHYVFDFAKDRVVWDVGHQCYVHKVLTGRAEKFEKLRQPNGLSGFPSPEESVCDQFSVGHAGTAVASALGLALGAQAKKSDEKVVAVVGDASIVNGLSFEGLNNTNMLKRQMLIILNDNSMAIDKTQGAFAQYLTRVSVSRSYEDLQRRTDLAVKRLPYFGEAIHDTLDRIKGGIKTTLMGRQKFEQLGIPFYGPIDGHDLPSLIKIMTAVSQIDRPVILHVCTQKGKGFIPATENPTVFHSPSPFIVEGETASFADGVDRSFTSAFSTNLGKVMERDEKVVAITAAMPDGTGLAHLRSMFPDRIYDVGIAESAAVDIAAGMAKVGLKPVVAIYSTFMQRSFDQVFQEVSLQKLPVILCMDRAGLVGGDGAVHHGFCDISLFRTLPNMILMAPMDDRELGSALDFAVESGRPCVIRYPRDIVPQLRDRKEDYECTPYELGRSSWIREGRDAVIVAYGSLAYEAYLAAETLATRGLDVGVVSGRFAKPLDGELFLDLLGDHNDMPVITVEDHAVTGGFGSAVLEFVQSHRLDARKLDILGMPDRYISQNSRRGQLEEVGLTQQAIARRVETMVKTMRNKVKHQPGQIGAESTERFSR